MPNQPTETSIPIGEWTIGSLKAYQDQATAGVKELLTSEIKRVDADIKQLNILLDERSITQEKAVAAALSATREAISKSEVATEKRFESVNEFRGQLADQTSTFLPRPEYVSAHQALIEKIDGVTTRTAAIESRSEGSQLTTGKIYAAIAAAVALLSILVMLSNGVF